MTDVFPLGDVDLLRQLVESLPSGVVLFEAVRDERGVAIDLRLRYMNATAREGQPDYEAALSSYATDLWPGMVRKGVLGRALRVLESGEDDNGEIWWDEEGYRAAAYEWHGRRVGTELLAWVFRDASVRVRQAGQLEEHTRLLRATVDRQSDLLRLTAALARALTIDDLLRALQQLAMPLVQVSVFALAVLTEEGGHLRYSRVTARGIETARSVAVEAAHPFAEVLREQAPLFVGSREELVDRWPSVREQSDSSEAQAWALLPLLGARRASGVLVFGFASRTPREGVEIALMEAVTALTTQAVDRARLYEAEHERATALQRALLPGTLPVVEGIGLAGRYAPAEQSSLVGGDWYDVIQLPSGRVGLVMGDAEGHSAQAAALMGQIRNVLRAYAHEGHGPAAVMRRVNRFLCEQAPEALATCCYAELNPTNGALTYVLAGHPPPLIVGPDGGTALLPETGDLLLGLDVDVDYDETTVVLDRGSTLALYTDGLVESRDVGLHEGLERLLAVAQEAATTEPHALADALLGGGRPGIGSRDDAALLLARFQALERSELEFSRVLPSDPSTPPAARHFVADVLRQWQLDELTDTAALLVTELATNAVLHTTSDVLVRVHRHDHAVRIEVTDQSNRLPQLRDPGDEDISGRGMLLVDALSDGWGTRPQSDGKTVWADLRVL